MTRSSMLAVALAFAALAVLIAASDADAKRLGGGRSFGAQRQSVAPPASTSGPAANPVMPAQPGTSAAKPAAPTPTPAAGGSRWLGPIAGIAAGLGLAALLSHFGLPEGFASVLLLALVAFGAVLLFRAVVARRTPAPAGMPPGHRESVPPRVEPVLASPPSVAPAPASGIPAGFDTERFLREAKTQFRRLQAAWDAGDRTALADVMTREMATEILSELDARRTHEATELLSLDAALLEVTTEGGAHWASVRFTGLVREDGAPQPVPLDEVWNLTKPVDGSSGWVLAGIRQMA